MATKTKKKNDNKGLIIIGALAFLLLGKAKGSSGDIKSKYYTISNVQHSNVANQQNITEQFEKLDPHTIQEINAFIQYVLDPLTDKLGERLDIDSWWRSPQLNQEVGGVADSYHLRGLAVDADSYINEELDNRRIVKALLKYDIPFTEMVLYGSYENPTQIHLAFLPERPTEKEMLFKDSNGDYHTLNKARMLQIYENVEV